MQPPEPIGKQNPGLYPISALAHIPIIGWFFYPTQCVKIVDISLTPSGSGYIFHQVSKVSEAAHQSNTLIIRI